jgi:hypothetical protein
LFEEGANVPDASNVKKISAYPFPIQLQSGTATTTGQVQKMTLEGFLAEIPSTPLQPGDRLEVSFEIPVFRVILKQSAVVVKLYNQWGATKSQPKVSAAPNAGDLTFGSPTAEGLAVVQLIEVHFQPLTDTGRSAISQFMRAIKQA